MAQPIRLPNLAEQAVLDALVVRLIVADEEQRWNQQIIQRHYLQNARLVGEQLRYVAEYEGTWLALLGWSAPALHLRVRDAWLGWSVEQRRTRRLFLAQNSRFLILADRHQFPNLASRALGLCCRRLSQDWLVHHGHPVVAVESFVDKELTRGTAYKASGWTLLGPTAGFGRNAQDFYERHDRPKQLWVRALDGPATAALKAAQLPPALAAYQPKVAVRCQVPAPRLPSLMERLPRLADPRGRQGLRHPWGAALGMVALAKLAGVPGAQREVAEFAKRLTQPQRRNLGCWRNPKSGRYEVPSQSTFYRVLVHVDYPAFERVVLGWQDDWLGPADPDELVVLDGKAIANAQGQLMVAAIGVPSGRVYGLEPVRPKDSLAPDDQPATPALTPAPAPEPTEPSAPAPAPAQPTPLQATAPSKENEIPAARRLLARAELAGRLISLDALHTQHQTAAQIVLDNGADYLFTLKANQAGLYRTAQTLVPSAFFPSGPDVTCPTHRPDRGTQPQPLRNPPTGHPPH